MNRLLFERRTFLKSAGRAILAAPAVSLLGGRAVAQPSQQVAVHPASATSKVTLDVRKYGATGDGQTKDTLAIQQTIERCSLLGGGEVVVPAGEYLVGALQLLSHVLLRLEEGATLNGSPDVTTDYPLRQVRWEGRWVKGYIGFISATDAENIGIVGPGRIVATPAIKGRLERPSGMRLPALLEFVNCRNVTVENCDTVQTGMWSIHPVYCENVTFKNVTIKSGADGIDVDSCRNVTIDGCTFDTSDDCISLKSGRGAEANAINRPTEDVQIRNCTFVDHNFACIGIGSETSAGVRRVRIDHCKFLGAKSHAIYIKSRPGRGAFVEDIAVDDIDVSGVQLGFLRVNNLNSGKHDEFDIPGDDGIPLFRNFRFSNVRVTDVPVLVSAVEIHPRKPLVGFTLTNVTGTCAKGISLANMRDVHLNGIAVTGFTGPLLAIADVTGTGLTGAATIEAAKLPEDVPIPATPYVLH